MYPTNEERREEGALHKADAAAYEMDSNLSVFCRQMINE